VAPVTRIVLSIFLKIPRKDNAVYRLCHNAKQEVSFLTITFAKKYMDFLTLVICKLPYPILNFDF